MISYPLIDQGMSLREEYARLTIQERNLRLRLERGEVECVHCERPKSKHIDRDRCDCSVTTSFFNAPEVKQLEVTSKALLLIEELQKIVIQK